jgi:hypothetical protein
MAQLTSIQKLKTQTPFRLDEVPDGIFACFLGDLDSKLATYVLAGIDEHLDDFPAANLSVFYVTQKMAQTSSLAVLYDENGEILKLCTLLCKLNEPCEALLLFSKKGDAIEHILTRKNPATNEDWVKYCIGFAQNYGNTKPEKEKYWRVGQIIPKTGDYLCIDCGNITTFQAGDVFYVCDVCMSGDPTGPTEGTEQGYWEFLG